MKVRIAEDGDAAQACLVIRRSIEELCSADHHGDQVFLQRWLANKTAANVLAWIASPDQQLLLAVDGDEIAAVGAASRTGEILLNYVSPDFRFRGASKALLQALETYLRDNGCDKSRLSSTATAHSFYRAMGYVDDGPAMARGPTTAQPMIKNL